MLLLHERIGDGGWRQFERKYIFCALGTKTWSLFHLASAPVTSPASPHAARLNPRDGSSSRLKDAEENTYSEGRGETNWQEWIRDGTQRPRTVPIQRALRVGLGLAGSALLIEMTGNSVRCAPQPVNATGGGGIGPGAQAGAGDYPRVDHLGGGAAAALEHAFNHMDAKEVGMQVSGVCVPTLDEVLPIMPRDVCSCWWYSLPAHTPIVLQPT